MKDAGYDVISVGKIFDIFDGEGLTESNKSKSSVHGMEQTIEIAVQVNGKVKARLNVAANIESADAIAAAKADPAVAEAIARQDHCQGNYVKGRLVNLAVKG